jgi:folate-binding protein YgfZ
MQTLWIEMNGKDTADFLHRQMSADLKALKKKGQGALSFWLNPMGRIELAGALWRLEEGFAFQCPLVTGLPGQDEVLAFLDRWHFGEEITFQATLKHLSFLNVKPFEGEPALSHTGFLWPSGQGFGATIFQEGHGLDVVPDPFDGIRRFGFEIQAGRNPLDLGLGDFIPQQKGCYPGQEVIERQRSKGQPASRCVLIHKPRVSSIEPSMALDEEKGRVCGVYSEFVVIWVRRLAVVEQLTFKREHLRVAKDPW